MQSFSSFGVDCFDRLLSIPFANAERQMMVCSLFNWENQDFNLRFRIMSEFKVQPWWVPSWVAVFIVWYNYTGHTNIWKLSQVASKGSIVRDELVAKHFVLSSTDIRFESHLCLFWLVQRRNKKFAKALSEEFHVKWVGMLNYVAVRFGTTPHANGVIAAVTQRSHVSHWLQHADNGGLGRLDNDELTKKSAGQLLQKQHESSQLIFPCK